MANKLDDPMRPAVSAPEIIAALNATGFPFEHLIVRALQSHGWSVSSNRYYADDVDGRAREFDLLAWKTKALPECDVLTTVLVSCKKDEKNTWALMSRPAPPIELIPDGRPVHNWTNVEPLREYFKNVEWKGAYVDHMKEHVPGFFEPRRDIFAFQCISPGGAFQPQKGGGAPLQGKRATAANNRMFDALESLFKAFDFEYGALEHRMKRPRVYQFNFAVVLDAPLVEVEFDNAEPVAREVDRALHLARYLVRRQPLSAHVHILRRDAFDGYLNNLDVVAIQNATFARTSIDAAYGAIRYNESWARYYFRTLLEPYVLRDANAALRRLRDDQKASELMLTMLDTTLVLCWMSTAKPS